MTTPRHLKRPTRAAARPRTSGQRGGRPVVAHVISHTHWDREWYQPFQTFRKRLVYQLSQLVELMERDPRFAYFHLDGQTRVVEDFSDGCPGMANRLLALIRAGRILVGPWYVMPDESLPSGESLVRNLLFGHRACRRYGARPLPVGYVTDIFGHISQLPQLLAGFGIESVLLHRGTPGENERSEMAWYGADGTCALLLRVNLEAGYGDLRYAVWDHTSVKFTGTLEERLRRFIADKRAQATTTVWLALEGNDHTGPYADLPERIAQLNALAPGVRFVHSSFPAYLRALRAAMGPRWQRGRIAFHGELRSAAKTGWWNELLAGVGSSRYDLKRRNDACEWLLSAWAEPLDTWCTWLGGDPQTDFLSKAWEYLLLNHPHDSLCGCSIDQVHRDMHYRFDQCRIIAEDAVAESLQGIASRIDTARLAAGDRALVVFNPAASRQAGIAVVDVEWPAAGLPADAVPMLSTADGKPLPVQVLEMQRDVRSRFMIAKHRGPLRQYGLAADGPHHRWTVAFPADLPAGGYATFGVSVGAPTSAPAAAGVRIAGAGIENDLVRVGVNTDGTVDITDRRTGHVLTGGMVFLDDGDAGDGWNHRSPQHDRTVSSAGCTARCIRVRDGLVGTLRVALALDVPAALDETRTARSAETVPLDIAVDITLRAGDPAVDFTATVHNRARDHRLRVLFPTGLRTDGWHRDTAFDLVERPVRLPDTTGWQEPAQEYHPFKNVVCIADEKTVVCALTRGIAEGCVQDDPRRPIALTLFRAFREVLFHEATEDSQLQGPLEFSWRLLAMPADASWRARVLQEVHRYKADLRALVEPRHAGTLPPEQTFVEVSGPLVLSAIKRAEQGGATVVRVWNPDSVPVTGALRFGVPIRSARACRLDETPGAPLAIADRQTIGLRVGPKKIVSVRVVPGRVRPSR